MKTISSKELRERAGEFEVIDIREPYEYAFCNIGSKHIPMGEVCSQLQSICKVQPIVIMCKSGKRASAVANLLETEFGYSNIWVLEGGIEAWRDAVAPELILE